MWRWTNGLRYGLRSWALSLSAISPPAGYGQPFSCLRSAYATVYVQLLLVPTVSHSAVYGQHLLLSTLRSTHYDYDQPPAICGQPCLRLRSALAHVYGQPFPCLRSADWLFGVGCNARRWGWSPLCEPCLVGGLGLWEGGPPPAECVLCTSSLLRDARSLATVVSDGGCDAFLPSRRCSRPAFVGDDLRPCPCSRQLHSCVFGFSVIAGYTFLVTCSCQSASPFAACGVGFLRFSCRLSRLAAM